MLSKARFNTSVAFPLFLAMMACGSSAPTPIVYGKDHCDFCRMSIVDARYGSELITRQGKAFRFDSIECLAEYTLKGDVVGDDVESLWVTSFDNPGQLVDALSVTYLRSADLPSPMGMNLTAFSEPAGAENAREKHQGEILYWTDVLLVVMGKSSSGRDAPEDSHQ
ncbi:MAG: nitrous oxide reductase accessory protein NosL [Candidatus Zixiibacteriota bacterium]